MFLVANVPKRLSKSKTILLSFNRIFEHKCIEIVTIIFVYHSRNKNHLIFFLNIGKNLFMTLNFKSIFSSKNTHIEAFGMYWLTGLATKIDLCDLFIRMKLVKIFWAFHFFWRKKIASNSVLLLTEQTVCYTSYPTTNIGIIFRKNQPSVLAWAN